MEVVEFEPGQSSGVIILDNRPNGLLEVHGPTTLEPVDGGSGTRITIYLDIPAMEGFMHGS